MKSRFAVVVVILLSFAINPASLQGVDRKENEFRNDIRRMMEMTGAAKIGFQVMDQMMVHLKPLAPEVPESVWEEVVAGFDPDEMIELVIPIYERHFTHDEIKELIAFYESRLGKKLIEKLPHIMQESMSVGEQWGQDIAEKVIKKLEADGYY